MEEATSELVDGPPIAHTNHGLFTIPDRLALFVATKDSNSSATLLFPAIGPATGSENRQLAYVSS